MRLAIRHISRFRFDEHAPHVLQRLRLRPQSGPSQTVRAWQVTIDGVEPTLTYADGLGNRVDLVRHERDKPEFAIVAAGVVETQDRAGILGHIDAYAPPWIHERTTDLTRAGEAIRALAEALPIEHKSLDALHWLMTEVHGRVATSRARRPRRATRRPRCEAVPARAAIMRTCSSRRRARCGFRRATCPAIC